MNVSKPNRSIVPAGLVKQLRHAPIGYRGSDPDNYGNGSLDRNGVEKLLDRLPEFRTALKQPGKSPGRRHPIPPEFELGHYPRKGFAGPTPCYNIS